MYVPAATLIKPVCRLPDDVVPRNVD